MMHEQPWGRDSEGMQGVIEDSDTEESLEHVEADFALPDTPAAVVDSGAAFWPCRLLVANHATSSGAQTLLCHRGGAGLSWAVNVRASVLLTQSFAAQHDDRRSGGRVVLFTSGQHLAPMAQEVPYAISKGAIHQMTLTLADALVDRGITVNTVNPGPTDTGWADKELFNQVQMRFRRVGGARPRTWLAWCRGSFLTTAPGSPAR